MLTARAGLHTNISGRKWILVRSVLALEGSVFHCWERDPLQLKGAKGELVSTMALVGFKRARRAKIFGLPGL